MPPLLEPSLKKQRTLRIFLIDQKRWLVDLRENSHEFKRCELHQDIKDNFGGDLLSRSSVSDCLKRDAVKLPKRCRKDAVKMQ